MDVLEQILFKSLHSIVKVGVRVARMRRKCIIACYFSEINEFGPGVFVFMLQFLDNSVDFFLLQ